MKPTQDDKANSKINDEIEKMAVDSCFNFMKTHQFFSYAGAYQLGYVYGAQAMAELKDVEIERLHQINQMNQVIIDGMRGVVAMARAVNNQRPDQRVSYQLKRFDADKLTNHLAEENQALRAELADKTEALSFYAKGKHFDWCGHEDFEPENPSGEPLNYECGGAEGSEFTLENGGYAKSILAKYEGGNK